MMNIILGLIPESIFFSLFIIFTKNYKNKAKNIVFTLLMITGYIILKQILPRNVYCQIIYLAYVPLLMFLLYRNKFHISDVFVMSWANIVYIGLTSICLLLINIFCNIYWVLYAINRLSMVLFLVFTYNKLNKFYKYIIPQWNRNRQKPNKIKALTIRNICVIGLNISIFIIYVCMLIS